MAKYQTIALLLLVGMLSALPEQVHAQESKRQASINVGRYPTNTELTAWLMYGLALADFVNKRKILDTAPDGPYVPSYEAEFEARQRQLKIWRELNEKSSYSLRYMDEMQKVESSGYLPEYIWHHHSGPTWGAPPAILRTEAFLKWASENLVGHVPHTGAHLVFGPSSRKAQ
jgi:hypothetical protein